MRNLDADGVLYVSSAVWQAVTEVTVSWVLNLLPNVIPDVTLIGIPFPSCARSYDPIQCHVSNFLSLGRMGTLKSTFHFPVNGEYRLPVTRYQILVVGVKKIVVDWPNSPHREGWHEPCMESSQDCYCPAKPR